MSDNDLTPDMPTDVPHRPIEIFGYAACNKCGAAVLDVIASVKPRPASASSDA